MENKFGKKKKKALCLSAQLSRHSTFMDDVWLPNPFQAYATKPSLTFSHICIFGISPE
jgi:hypothetical protein